MKTRVFTIPAVILLLAVSQLQAVNVDFYTDGTIESGDDYYIANSYNDAQVEMTGGEVSGFNAYDSSVLNLQDGIIHFLYADDTSCLNIYGGEILGTLGANGSATLNLYGGTITVVSGLSAWESATVNIYGYGFELTGEGNNLYLSGFWLDGTPFNDIWLRGPGTYDHVNLIPEPATLLLLAFGSVMINRRKQ